MLAGVSLGYGLVPTPTKLTIRPAHALGYPLQP